MGDGSCTPQPWRFHTVTAAQNSTDLQNVVAKISHDSLAMAADECEEMQCDSQCNFNCIFAGCYMTCSFKDGSCTPQPWRFHTVTATQNSTDLQNVVAKVSHDS